MSDIDRSKALLEVFRQGLCYFDEVQTKTMLGDRLSYIGMSDLGRYSECPRQAVFSKLNIRNDNLDDQFVLQRGHWFEEGVRQVLGNLGMNMFSQLEIDGRLNGVPIKAHLDFTLIWDKPSLAVRILEVKSMSQIPELPYSSHEFQVSGQTALLKELWNKPVFTLRDFKGVVLDRKQTFSELCKKHFGIHASY